VDLQYVADFFFGEGEVSHDDGDEAHKKNHDPVKKVNVKFSPLFSPFLLLALSLSLIILPLPFAITYPKPIVPVIRARDNRGIFSSWQMDLGGAAVERSGFVS
jgi:hypothetical protein